MAFENLVPLPGSEKEPHGAAQPVGAVDPAERVDVTVLYAEGAEPDQIIEYAAHRYIDVLEVEPEIRRVALGGTAEQMQAAFGVSLDVRALPSGEQFRHRSGVIMVPEELADIVTGVFGLDNRPVARPRFVMRDPGIVAEAAQLSFTPAQLAQVYNFPANRGAGINLGFLSLGGGTSDSNATAAGLDPSRCQFVGVDGATNQYSGDVNSADGENELDRQTQLGVCPDATVYTVEAPNTDRGFVDGCLQFLKLKLAAASVSWGSPISSWTAQSRAAVDSAFQQLAAAGTPVFCASGDGGATDGTGGKVVDYPAASPWAVGVGGTTVTSTNPLAEKVWSGSGGGFTSLYNPPAGQPGSNLGSGRMAPDVASDADPASGCVVYLGSKYVFGGTSWAAPTWAALWGRMRAAGMPAPTGAIHAALYGAASAFHDITSGSNGYAAGAGPDPCTGLGTPDGGKLFAALVAGNSQPPNPTPPSPPTPPAPPVDVQAIVDAQISDIVATLQQYAQTDPGHKAEYNYAEIVEQYSQQRIDGALSGATVKAPALPKPGRKHRTEA